VNGLKVKGHFYEETPTLFLQSDSTVVYGNSGCNYFHGKYKMQDKNGIVFEDIASTRKLCPDMKIENAFLEMLNNTQTFGIDADTLIIYNNNTPIGIFVADYLATE
jgi:Heat shock protein